MSILSKLLKTQEERARLFTLTHLRSMSERQLVDCGFSPQLISRGVSAWPWRELPEVTAPLLFEKSAIRKIVSKDAKLDENSREDEVLLSQDAA